MDCRAARPLLSAYMDNDLTPDESRAIQEHVEQCADCAATLASYRTLRAAIRALPPVAPAPDLRAAVFAKATPAYRRRAWLFDLGQQGLATAALVVILLALVFTASLVIQRRDERAYGDPNVPPRIVQVEPRGGTVGWSPTRPIRITFNKPMDQPSVAAALHVEITNAPTATAEAAFLQATLAWDGTTLLIGQHGGLRPDTDYRLWFDTTVARDHFGNRLLRDYTMIQLRTAQLVAVQEPATATAVAVVTPPAVPTATEPAPPATATVAPPSTVTARSEPPAPAPPGPPAPAPTSPVAPAPTSPEPTAAPHVAPPTAMSAPSTPTAVAPTSTSAPATATPVATTAPTATAPPKLPYPVAGGFGLLYDASPTVRSRLGLPTAAAAQVAVSTLQFERGMMYRRGDTSTIYVIFFEQPGVWYRFADSWTEGSPSGGGDGPVAGQYLPPRGFGKVWRDNPDFKTRLGYALTPDAQTFTGNAQSFEGGTMLWSQGRWIYVLYSDGTYERYADESK